MKKMAFIGLLLIGFIFLNCNSKKSQKEVLENNDPESIVQQEPDSATYQINDNLNNEEGVSSTLESEDLTKPPAETTETIEKETAKTTDKTNKLIEKETVNEEINIEDTQEDVTATELETEKKTETITETEQIIEKEFENMADTVTTATKDKTDSAPASNSWIVPAEYQSMKNPTDPKIDLAIGKSLYNKHCKSCHGSEGYGDGPKADEMDGDLGDFSSPEFQAQSDGALFYKTSIGRDDMPEYTKKMPDDEDRWLIVNYMRTMAE